MDKAMLIIIIRGIPKSCTAKPFCYSPSFCKTMSRFPKPELHHIITHYNSIIDPYLPSTAGYLTDKIG